MERNYNIEVLPLEPLTLGEGPHWDSESEELYYVDITGQEVHRYHPQSGTHSSLKIYGNNENEKSVSLIIPIAGKFNSFVISHGRCLKTFQWDPQSESLNLTTIFDADDGFLEARYNDGKCDASGRLWAGTLFLPENNPTPVGTTHGAMYRLDLDGKVTKQWTGIGVSNGITWSLDNKTLYFVDSILRRVDGFDYDLQTGIASNRHPVFDYEVEDEIGFPDGMTIDSEGYLWVACFNGYQVIRINPETGKVVDRIIFPVKEITSVTFGGKNLDTLYVTSSKHFLKDTELQEQLNAGALFKITNINVKGASGGIPYRGIL